MLVFTYTNRAGYLRESRDNGGNLLNVKLCMYFHQQIVVSLHAY